jgi:lysophospholipase L1-like esterase
MRRSVNHVLWYCACLFLFSGCTNWIVGDSITFLAEQRLEGSNPSTEVDADAGRGAHLVGLGGMPDGWAAVLQRLPQVAARQWLVVELGTNDLDRPATEWSSFVTAVVGRLPDDRCLAWVTPYQPMKAKAAAAYEKIVRTALLRQPCRAVIHWDDAARTHPELTKDGYHPNARGVAALTCMIDSVLYRSCTTPHLITRP